VPSHQCGHSALIIWERLAVVDVTAKMAAKLTNNADDPRRSWKATAGDRTPLDVDERSRALDRQSSKLWGVVRRSPSKFTFVRGCPRCRSVTAIDSQVVLPGAAAGEELV
jgi:hypothetical protein